MKILPLIVALLISLSSCSSPKNNIKRNMEKLDELYGYCDNPHRDLGEREYKICKQKQRGSGPDFKFEDKSLAELILGSDKGVQYAGNFQTINPHLWNGALQTISEYPIKNIDSTGGYIETEWITQANNPNQRCIIKINILSNELVSNGVNTNIICQNKINDEWQSDQLKYENESKQLTITILNNASKLSQASLND